MLIKEGIAGYAHPCLTGSFSSLRWRDIVVGECGFGRNTRKRTTSSNTGEKEVVLQRYWQHVIPHENEHFFGNLISIKSERSWKPDGENPSAFFLLQKLAALRSYSKGCGSLAVPDTRNLGLGAHWCWDTWGRFLCLPRENEDCFSLSQDFHRSIESLSLEKTTKII